MIYVNVLIIRSIRTEIIKNSRNFSSVGKQILLSAVEDLLEFRMENLEDLYKDQKCLN